MNHSSIHIHWNVTIFLIMCKIQTKKISATLNFSNGIQQKFEQDKGNRIMYTVESPEGTTIRFSSLHLE